MNEQESIHLSEALRVFCAMKRVQKIAQRMENELEYCAAVLTGEARESYQATVQHLELTGEWEES